MGQLECQHKKKIFTITFNLQNFNPIPAAIKRNEASKLKTEKKRRYKGELCILEVQQI